MKREFVSHKEAADLLNVHSATVYIWVKAGKLKQYRSGRGKAVYAKAEVLALLEPVGVTR